ncbi:glycosyltransferase [Megalodesulfovibrio paquesii]
MKIDLHVHSRYSDRPSQWALRKLGAPESFVDPVVVYELCKLRGMHKVTVTDHNTLGGSLAIAHLPDTFLSEEITAHFPEDGCKVHVLSWNITEAQHEDIQKVRRNIYELTAYLRASGIAHALAHPLYAVNDRLTIAHLEKLLVLFKTFEVNGTRDGMQNNSVKAILALLTPALLDELANKHDLDPRYDPTDHAPWHKHLVGGSDDHSGLHVARTFTQIEGPDTLEAFFLGLKAGRSQPVGVYSNPKTLAHTLYGIGYQFYKSKSNLDKLVHKDRFLTFLDHFLAPLPSAATPVDGLFRKTRNVCRAAARTVAGLGGLREKGPPRETHALIRAFAEEEFYARTGGKPLEPVCRMPWGEAEKKWFRYVKATSNRLLKHYADEFMTRVVNADVFQIFQGLASAGTLYTMLAPYFVSYSVFTKDRVFCRKALTRFKGAGDAGTQPNIAHFTDTFFETNGVAMTLQEQVRLAQATGKRYTVITCDPGCTTMHDGLASGPGVQNFKPIGRYELPEYPELKLFYPPFLEMLAYVYENEFTHIHSATPGPIGVAALLIARTLKLPISGTYHTALPQYAMTLTGDESMEDLMWKAMVWYYNQMDKVYVPSAAFGEELGAKGVHRDKITLYPRGVDTLRFTPAKRNGFFDRYAGRQHPEQPLRLLYVGRISKEKNLHLLTQAWKALLQREGLAAQLELVLVGDGPYRAEMEAAMQGTPCLFTGILEGDDLAAAYASSDLFVFPSSTDTFGKVVLEAQASGLPVIVTDRGGPQENVEDGVTGRIVQAGDATALATALVELTADPQALRAMGASARKAMEARSSARAFDQAFALYGAETCIHASAQDKFPQ